MAPRSKPGHMLDVPGDFCHHPSEVPTAGRTPWVCERSPERKSPALWGGGAAWIAHAHGSEPAQGVLCRHLPQHFVIAKTAKASP